MEKSVTFSYAMWLIFVVIILLSLRNIDEKIMDKTFLFSFLPLIICLEKVFNE